MNDASRQPPEDHIDWFRYAFFPFVKKVERIGDTLRVKVRGRVWEVIFKGKEEKLEE